MLAGLIDPVDQILKLNILLETWCIVLIGDTGSRLQIPILIHEILDNPAQVRIFLLGVVEHIGEVAGLGKHGLQLLDEAQLLGVVQQNIGEVDQIGQIYDAALQQEI